MVAAKGAAHSTNPPSYVGAYYANNARTDGQLLLHCSAHYCLDDHLMIYPTDAYNLVAILFFSHPCDFLLLLSLQRAKSRGAPLLSANDEEPTGNHRQALYEAVWRGERTQRPATFRRQS